ncbi:MAG: hypothetical protein EXR69_00600 [Myxococcales bacterium]|nr:hypothetical protein [Myxococcales bacterium]
MSAALLEFDEPGRPSAPLGGDAPSVIADTLRTQGVDAPGSLYNEALNLAREGLLGPSSQRLQMLICLDPDDADAHLLLCKVLASQGKPSEALARLEAAVEAGAVSPGGLREHLEGLIRTDRQKDEDHRSRVSAREQGEIKALRLEARNLRSETVRLEAEVTETKGRESKWRVGSMVGAGAAVLAVLAFGVVTLFSAQGVTEVAAVAPPVPTEILQLQAGAAAAAPVDAVVPSAPQAPVQAAAVDRSVGLPTSHLVESGDSLYSLAGLYYGDKMKFAKIRDANKAVLKGGIALKLGMKLSIPR